MTDPRELPEEAVALFRSDPADFVARRGALATALRAEGRDADARRVAALRKPTVIAWAVNQLADRDPDGVRALLDAGAEVRASQQAALSGKRGASDRLRQATGARRSTVAELARVATSALEEQGGKTTAHADAIVQALETCSVDPGAGAELAAGTMQRPPAAAAGFGDVFGLTSLEGGATLEGGTSVEEPPGSDRSVTGAVPDVRSLKADVARLRRDRDGAAKRATSARSAADGFAHELEGMRRRLEVVERKHAAAESKASAAELDLARAERELERASETLDDAGR